MGNIQVGHKVTVQTVSGIYEDLGMRTGTVLSSRYSWMHLEFEDRHQPEYRWVPRSLLTKVMEDKVTDNAKRFNSGKIDFTLLPVDALEAEARVWMFGEAKYGRDNWQKLWGDDTQTVVLQSLLRHAFAILQGETVDKETGELHAAHIRCNAAMLIRHHNDSQ